MHKEIDFVALNGKGRRVAAIIGFFIGLLFASLLVYTLPGLTTITALILTVASVLMGAGMGNLIGYLLK